MRGDARPRVKWSRCVLVMADGRGASRSGRVAVGRGSATERMMRAMLVISAMMMLLLRRLDRQSRTGRFRSRHQVGVPADALARRVVLETHPHDGALRYPDVRHC